MEADEDEAGAEEAEVVIVTEVESLVDAEAEELVTLIDGIVESVTLLLAELEALEAEELTVVAEAEAETDLELDADDDGAVVEAEDDRLADEDDETAAELELEAARDELELELALELAAAEVVVVVLEVNLPKIDILYHPPHF